jgi:hypothetical protein
LITAEIDAQLTKAAQRALQKTVDRSGYSTPGDPVERLASLGAPTGDRVGQHLTAFVAGADYPHKAPARRFLDQVRVEISTHVPARRFSKRAFSVTLRF